ncbi:MAG: SWIM zinc finger family protein [Sedimentisphaerales bacterium]|jgi:uncharacterized Zn finger protein
MGIKKLEVLAKSNSSETPYTVECYLEENKISVFCSCPAGDNRLLCKHVKKIVAGDESILYDKNQKSELQMIVDNLKGTEISVLVSELDRQESIMEEAKRNAEKLKKKLKPLVLNELKQ